VGSPPPPPGLAHVCLFVLRTISGRGPPVFCAMIIVPEALGAFLQHSLG